MQAKTGSGLQTRRPREPGFTYPFRARGLRKNITPKGACLRLPMGEKIKGGLIRARRINYKEAYKLYG